MTKVRRISAIKGIAPAISVADELTNPRLNSLRRQSGVAPDTEETQVQAPASAPAVEASAPNAVLLQDSVNPPPVRSETSDDDTAANEADSSVKVESQETVPEKPRHR
jgi:hypothetical protein